MALLQQLGRTKNVTRSSKKYLEEALYSRLFKEGSSEISVRQRLNQFLKSSKRVFKWEVDNTLKKLRDRKLYYPALRLSETMVTKRGMNKTVGDQAIHLDLVAKVRGIPAAENYFIDLPESSKNHLTYGALLNCYCKELMTEKAEALMEKMKELNLPLGSMSYNSLMTLYTKIGQAERVPEIIREMKSYGIILDSYTYNVWMRALAATNDISGVERVIDEMKRDTDDSDWTIYSNIASIYVDAGLFEKAEKALKELEKRNTRRDLSAFQFLITLNGRVGSLHEIYRIWRSLRLSFQKTANISYLNMIQVLVHLKDLPGAEKCFRDWEKGCSTYDIRIANALIGAYVKNGLLEKAQELKERACRRGAKPNAKTWEIFLEYYLKNGDIKLAVDCVANASSTGKGDRGKWVPSSETIGTVMRHFEQEKDVDGTEGFLEILNKAVDHVGGEVFESLIRTYAAAGRTSSTMHRRLKMEKVEVSEASEKLVDMISVD